ncbi:histidine phosphatase family protein [Desulfobulbus alkaliphilus]|uniref:histidine phosphatase family protein n=1 Tax=Desulfobulbus alkaliphilus TaxID=869814 RepID=UPI001965BDF9|nr:histidine phosphatase family protein [Desulfobulbus alkaliphilus]MBM9536525.1 histidine phosphatase family protein [Desulfobulbus alkaliphilus]
MRTLTSTFSGRLYRILLLMLLTICIGTQSESQASQQAWQALQEGTAVGLIRHAIAPGTGDPPGFLLGDCLTQRNLSQRGRIQSQRIGEFFRAHGIREASIYSSQWCRCLETARLLELGPVTELTSLNSFFNDRANGPKKTEKTRAFVSAYQGKRPLILVTHQVNITALTGIFPASGEIIIVQRTEDGLGQVLGRFNVPADPAQ